MTRPILWTLLAVSGLSVVIGSSLAPPQHGNARSERFVSTPALVKQSRSVPAAPMEVGRPTFMSPQASPIAVHEARVFVANTPADTVDVIDAESREITHRIAVGVDPVSVAVRPDGKEVWVSNHISDSVSVIDADRESPTYLQVVATIQDIDEKSKATRFDEPVGIAFANNEKAYVALSSENRIAVVDVDERRVTKSLFIPAQDPREIVVQGDRLYVIPFESNNKTQLSGGTGDLDGDLVTFDAHEHSVANNNVLSLGAVLDIIKHPRVPDRDLFVFDTTTDELIQSVDTLGTLLYGMAVDSQGQVFVAQTDARNDANGRSGTKDHGLAELENRAFLNQVTAVEFQEGVAQAPRYLDLEPAPPEQPQPGEALATPFAIKVTGDDSTLVVSAAASDKIFTMDAKSGEVLGRVDVDAVPRGIALVDSEGGKPSRAWVLNAVANTVSLVDVSEPSRPSVVEQVELEDPTHEALKRGRIAFNTARASTTETFACASCHPDGHTDQLLWVLKTPVVTGGDQIMPRSTMPIRGLRDTAPFHWDGIPGDPYGGNNSANVHGSDPPNADINDPTSTTRHLIDGGLASTMAMVDDETVNDEGKSGRLTAQERDDMALFLLGVPFPPAQRRAYDNVVSKRANDGFRLFHIDGDRQGGPTPNVCGNCHRMPFLVSTNTPGTGMDAPTWRGAYDRFLILPQGRLNIIDFDFYRGIAEYGIPERNMWQFSWAGRRRFDPVWDMVLEGSTGYAGAFARQATVNTATAEDKLTQDLVGALEVAAAEGAVVLEVDGVLTQGDVARPVTLQFDPGYESGSYVNKQASSESFQRDELIALAKSGEFIGTFTGRHGSNADVDHPQPALWTVGPIEQQRGRQDFPIVHADQPVMTVSGRHFQEDASLFVDGRRVNGIVQKNGAEFEITLDEQPPKGMHLLQVQTPHGQFSNDFIFHVAADAEDARKLQRRLDREHVDQGAILSQAASRADLDEMRELLEEGHDIDGHGREMGTPLATAALHGHLDVVKFLLDEGADVNATNGDGNTPLLVAAFACRSEIVELLLKHGASTRQKNDRGETPYDVIASDLDEGTRRFYLGVGSALGIEFDLEFIEKERPRLAKLIQQAMEVEEDSEDGERSSSR